MNGLSRGFMYAGARRVIASLGKVNNGSTSELMNYFYGGLKLRDGVNFAQTRPATALRAAQLKMMELPLCDALITGPRSLFKVTLAANAVLATLWPLADESAPWLMGEFYRKRLEGSGMVKAEVLRRPNWRCSAATHGSTLRISQGEEVSLRRRLRSSPTPASATGAVLVLTSSTWMQRTPRHTSERKINHSPTPTTGRP